MFKRMLLEWLVGNDPELLEELLDKDILEDWLDRQLKKMVETVALLEAKGLPPWQAEEQARANVMPSDMPEPDRELREEYWERVDDLRMAL